MIDAILPSLDAIIFYAWVVKVRLDYNFILFQLL